MVEILRMLLMFVYYGIKDIVLYCIRIIFPMRSLMCLKHLFKSSLIISLHLSKKGVVNFGGKHHDDCVQNLLFHWKTKRKD